MYKPFFNRGINDLSTSAPGLFSTNLISVNRWCFGDGIVHVWENGDEKGVKYFGIWVEKGFISLFAHEQRGVPIQISPWGNLGLIQNYLNYQSNHQVKSIGNQSVFGYVQKSQPNPTNPTQPNPTQPVTQTHMESQPSANGWMVFPPTQGLWWDPWKVSRCRFLKLGRAFVITSLPRGAKTARGEWKGGGDVWRLCKHAHFGAWGIPEQKWGFEVQVIFVEKDWELLVCQEIAGL